MNTEYNLGRRERGFIIPGPSLFGKRPSGGPGDALWGSVVQYLKCNGVNGGTAVVDETGRIGWACTGQTVTSTTVAEYGGSSLFIGTSGGASAANGVSAPWSTDFNFGSGNFCIEWSMYRTSNVGFQTMLDYGGANPGGIVVQTGNGTGLLIVYAGSLTPAFNESSSPALNTWHKYRLERVANVLTLYRSGVVVGSGPFAGTISRATDRWRWGSAFNNYPLVGYLSQIRVTRAARDGTPYTPATTPFPNHL